MVGSSDLSPEAHRRALKRKLAGIRGKLAVVKREIAEIQAQEKPTTDNPRLFGQQSPSHPGLRAQGYGWKRIASQLEVGVGTVIRAARH